MSDPLLINLYLVIPLSRCTYIRCLSIVSDQGRSWKSKIPESCVRCCPSIQPFTPPPLIKSLIYQMSPLYMPLSLPPFTHSPAGLNPSCLAFSEISFQCLISCTHTCLPTLPPLPPPPPPPPPDSPSPLFFSPYSLTPACLSFTHPFSHSQRYYRLSCLIVSSKVKVDVYCWCFGGPRCLLYSATKTMHYILIHRILYCILNGYNVGQMRIIMCYLKSNSLLCVWTRSNFLLLFYFT